MVSLRWVINENRSVKFVYYLTCILNFSNTGIMSRIEAPYVVKSSSVLFINCRMLSLVTLFFLCGGHPSECLCSNQ